ncbi:MAG: hypothetical protein M3O30_01385 [Planctomycetota bacterium]|nr:hypothetical protein [Planctomycetota bacterium]
MDGTQSRLRRCAVCMEHLEGRRLFSEGVLDATFGTGGLVLDNFGAVARARAMVVQSDDKMVVAGVEVAGGVTALGLTRRNADGSADTSFGNNGNVIANFGGQFVTRAMVIDGQGRILVAGSDQGAFAVARFTASGAIDTSFGSGNGEAIARVVNGQILTGLVLQPSGDIVGGGQSTLVRLTSDGQLDASFGSGGFVVFGYGPVKGLAAQADGGILVAGNDGGGGVVARFTINGRFDPTFFAFANFAPDAQHGEFRGVSIGPGGLIYAAGHATNPNSDKQDMVIASFNADGTRNSAFGIGGLVIESFSAAGLNDLFNAVTVQPDGKVLAAGTTSPAGANEPRLAVARFNTDGTLDATFGSGGLVNTDFNSNATFGQTAWAVGVQSGGKIVAAGAGGGNFDIARYGQGFSGIVNGKLTVTGTENADTITVENNAANAQYTVMLDGISQTYNSALVSSIEIDALGGNDSVTIGHGVIGALVSGGAGDDTLIGGDGSDTLIGGAGNDLIQGMAGNDSIDGGAGNNTLQGAGGNDTIITGAGNSLLYGGAGNDSLGAANGFADTLNGGTGINHGTWDAGLDLVANVGP